MGDFGGGKEQQGGLQIVTTECGGNCVFEGEVKREGTKGKIGRGQDFRPAPQGEGAKSEE